MSPSLLGGLVLIRSLDPFDIIASLCPQGFTSSGPPAQRLETRTARAVLPATVSRETALRQAANVAALVAGACLGDLALLGRAIDDAIAEPVRAPLIPGFSGAKDAALRAGALGCSISGAGPTAFAFAADQVSARQVGEAMVHAYREQGIAATAQLTTVDSEGATAW